MALIEARRGILGLAFAIVLSAPAFGHGNPTHSAAPRNKAAKAEQMPFGIAGDSRNVARTIDMDALDTFRFIPSTISVKRGETIRFIMHNRGTLMHEIVIGTMAGLHEHAELMKKFPEMEHEEPYMSHVAPGKVGEIVWRFNRAGTFNFACLIAGHFEAGMVGTISVR